MESNISRPKWLTNSLISELKEIIKACPNPYTEEEVAELESWYWGDVEWLGFSSTDLRKKAYDARKLLSKYNIKID